MCTTATCACFAALGPSITSLPNSAAAICPFRRMVREAHNLSFWRLHILADGLHMLCFGEWSTQAITGMVPTLHPTLPQARQHTLYAGLSLWNLDIKTFWAHLWPLPSKRGKAAHRHGTRAQQLPLPSPSLKSTYIKIRDATSCSRGAFYGISVVLSPSSNVHEGRISLGGAECPWSCAGGLRQ